MELWSAVIGGIVGSLVSGIIPWIIYVQSENKKKSLTRVESINRILTNIEYIENQIKDKLYDLDTVDINNRELIIDTSTFIGEVLIVKSLDIEYQTVFINNYVALSINEQLHSMNKIISMKNKTYKESTLGEKSAEALVQKAKNHLRFSLETVNQTYGEMKSTILSERQKIYKNHLEKYANTESQVIIISKRFLRNKYIETIFTKLKRAKKD